jgi:hypothetical protein
MDRNATSAVALTHSHVHPPLLTDLLPTTIQYITDTEDAFTSTPSLSSFLSPTPNLLPHCGHMILLQRHLRIHHFSTSVLLALYLQLWRLVNVFEPTFRKLHSWHAVMVHTKHRQAKVATGEAFASEMGQEITAEAGPGDGHPTTHVIIPH